MCFLRREEGRTGGVGVGFQEVAGFEVFEARRAVEGEVDLVAADQVQEEQFVTAGAQRREGGADFVAVFVAVGQDDNDLAGLRVGGGRGTGQERRVKGAGIGGPASGGFEAFQSAQDAFERLALLARRHGDDLAVGDGVQADLVALRLGEVGQRGGEQARGIELTPTRAGAGGVCVAHRGRRVEDHADSDGAFPRRSRGRKSGPSGRRVSNRRGVGRLRVGRRGTG